MKSGDVLGMAGSAAQDAFKGTEVAKASGAAGGDPLSMISQGLGTFMNLFAAIENVNKLMNPLATTLGAMFEVVGPAVNEALEPFILTLETIGKSLGEFLLPIIKVIGDVFLWFNDSVLVPVANFFIDIFNAFGKVIWDVSTDFTKAFQHIGDFVGDVFAIILNGIIGMINWVMFWVADKDKIKPMALSTDSPTATASTYVPMANLGTTAEMKAAEAKAKLAKETKALTDANGDLAKSYTDQLKPAIFRFFDSLKGFGGDIASTIVDNLVNGFSGDDFMYAMQEYITKAVVKAAVFTESFTAQVSAIGADLAAAISGGLTGAQLDSLKARLAGLYTSATVSAEAATNIVNASFGSYDVGSLNISGDQIAKLHNREMVLTAGLAEQARTAGVYIGPPAGLGEVGSLTGSSRQTINLNASGVLNVDGREIGRVAFQYGDQFMGAAYGA